MKLTYIIIFCSICCYVSCFTFKNNKNVKFNFYCYENHRATHMCNHGHGYTNCRVLIKFYITEAELKNQNLNQFNIFEKVYNIPNHVGMCKKGLHDTRGELKTPYEFNSNSNKMLFQAGISIKPEEEKDPQFIVKYHSSVDFNNIGNLRVEMKPDKNIISTYIKIVINVKMKCNENFDGNKCERFCVNTEKYFNCTSDNQTICTNEQERKKCNTTNSSELIYEEILKECKCKKSEDNNRRCGEQYISCLQNALRCKIQIGKTERSCKQISKKFNLYIPPQMLAISIVIIGLILITLMLLISLLLVYKKIERMKRSTNTTNDTYMEVFRRKQRPLPKIQYNDDSRESYYIKPMGIYENCSNNCESENSSRSIRI